MNWISFFMRFGVPDRCPKCDSSKVKKTGGSGRGTETWKCGNCGETGSSSSGW